jgi:hypothetical protein
MINLTGKYHAKALISILFQFNQLSMYTKTDIEIEQTVNSKKTLTMVNEFKFRAVESDEHTMDIIGYNHINYVRRQMINIPLMKGISYEMFYKVEGDFIVLILQETPYKKYKITLRIVKSVNIFECMFESIHSSFASNMLNFNVNKELEGKGWVTEWHSSDTDAAVWSKQTYAMTPNKHEEEH